MSITEDIFSKYGADANPILIVGEVIEWSAAAAREAKDYAEFNGEDPDPEPGMGLWQSFQDRFPKDKLPGDYDLYITAWTKTYEETLKALAPVKGPQVGPDGFVYGDGD